MLGDNMVNKFTKIKRTMALMGATALSAGAFAFAFDAEILIQRALNSPTLTVKYDGANASLVELRINGEKVDPKRQYVLRRGETIRLATPGGGGHGARSRGDGGPAREGV